MSEDMKQVERLTRASADDPESEPYRSLYAARELLAGLRAGLCGCPGELSGGCREDWHVLCACLHLQLAGSYSSTEETEQGRESYEACLQSLEGVRSKVKTAGLSMVAYNQLGLLWGNRSERQKALEYLLKSKAVYESHIGLPAPLTEKQWLLLDEEVGESEREKAFEDLHTHTLFYLAQVYGNLSQPSLSALYCQQTLSRQLDTCCCDPIDWSLNAATLSQHYLGTGALVQARHCLACASRMLCRHEERVEEEGKEPSAEAKDQLQHTKADISLCWAKYSIGVLQCSKDGEDTGGGARARSGEAFTFHSLDVSELESAIPAELVTSYESARPLFLLGQRHLDAARQFYTMESFASDCVAIIQDRSLLYKLLAHFEADASLKCRMHKRRIDMLSDALNQLNPQHFLMLCRQLMYELAEIHYGMVDLKIVQSSESPSHHAIAKINRFSVWGVWVVFNAPLPLQANQRWSKLFSEVL